MGQKGVKFRCKIINFKQIKKETTLNYMIFMISI